MARLDDLPPDLRATLSLLVDRGKSYAQVADLLGIPESAVRDRAHAALDALAGDPDALESPPASPSAAPSGRSTRRPRAAEPAVPPSGGHTARSARSPSASSTLPVSRRGGALLLAGIVVVVVVVVLLLTSGGGSHTSSGTTTSATTPANASTGTQSNSSKKTPSVVKQLTLTSPEPGSKSIGIVEILAEGTQHAFYLAAEHLPPTHGFFYAVWLYNSPTSTEAISKSPTVGSDGRLQGGALLPSNAADFHQILLTRETSEQPTHPGPTVLSGAFALK